VRRAAALTGAQGPGRTIRRVWWIVAAASLYVALSVALALLIGATMRRRRELERLIEDHFARRMRRRHGEQAGDAMQPPEGPPL
jgi:hypothetical protein